MASASSQTPPVHLATFTDLAAIPEDRRFHEILDGELVHKLAPSFEHGLGQGLVSSWVIRRFSRQPNGPSRPGGWWIATEVEIKLSRHQTVRPDLAGWRRDRAPERPSGHPVTLRPDWVCEIMSDGDARRRDAVQKRRIYADHGIPHYWLLDTQRQVLIVLRLTDDGYVEALQAARPDRIRAEPFEAVELPVGVLFGDDED